MKKGFYPRLAWDGIRKNRRLYLPYLLTCVGTVMMFYIVTYLSELPERVQMHGGDIMRLVMILGIIVIGIFAVIFLFYTHSFLIRRRNAEFGLYNVLGMNKKNISRILLWETLITAAIAIVGGLFFGIVFSKLAELVLVNIVAEEVSFSLHVSLLGVVLTVAVFAVIFFAILLASQGRIRLSKPLNLLHSEHAGEKPPKSNWIVAVLGAVILLAAYVLAVSIKMPLDAITYFFIAVVMVIVATYLLFISGSVTLCRALQKNTKYYYRTDHFVSVSSMAFRMKRNGAGLASICILSTMVLVMLSSTSCMFFGGTATLEQQNPREVTVGTCWVSGEGCTAENAALLERKIAESSGGRATDFLHYNVAAFTALQQPDGTLATDQDVLMAAANTEKAREIYIFSAADLAVLGGESVTLQPGEAVVYTSRGRFTEDTLQINGAKPLRVTETRSGFPIAMGMEDVVICWYVVVDDWADCAAQLYEWQDGDMTRMSLQVVQYCCFNVDGDADAETEVMDAFFRSAMTDDFDRGELCMGFMSHSIGGAREEFTELNGSLFFLGIVLSIVFIAAEVLMMYYKQLSEGYEDRARFDIMKKVGMTDTDIRRSINTQVRTVFLAPLILSGVHLCFAFPLIHRILQVLGTNRLWLLIGVNVICYAIFTLCYLLIYKLTARAYYHIVSADAND